MLLDLAIHLAQRCLKLFGEILLSSRPATVHSHSRLSELRIRSRAQVAGFAENHRRDGPAVRLFVKGHSVFEHSGMIDFVVNWNAQTNNPIQPRKPPR